MVKIQRGITLDILNEIMCFKRKFVHLSTSKNFRGGVLIHHSNIILNFFIYMSFLHSVGTYKLHILFILDHVLSGELVH